MITLISFLLIAVLQSGSPGPSSMLVIYNGVHYGKTKSLVALTGDLLGIFLIGSASIFGLSYVVSNSTLVYFIMSLLGGIYLIYLGIIYYGKRNNLSQNNGNTKVDSLFDLWTRSFMISLTNPKAVLFFTALFPTLIKSSRQSYGWLFYLALFCVIKYATLGWYIIFAEIMKEFLRKKKSIYRINIFTAVVFVIFGVLIIYSGIRQVFYI